jgi:hypothetical protein
MEELTSKTVAVFSRPFTVPGFNETLPAGEYEIETELVSPPDQQDPAAWKTSVLVKLHPQTSHPGLARSLTVSLADLDYARAKDKQTGRALSDYFLEEMLADPMVRLVMEADGVSAAHMRHLYSGARTPQSDRDVLDRNPARLCARGMASIHAAENEGMPPRPETPSPWRITPSVTAIRRARHPPRTALEPWFGLLRNRSHQDLPISAQSFSRAAPVDAASTRNAGTATFLARLDHYSDCHRHVGT